MKYNYKTVYEKNESFYNERPKAKELLIRSNLILTVFFILSYLVLLCYVVFAVKEPIKTTCVIFIPALGFFLASALRLAIEKPRPYAPDGAGITPFIQKKKADNKSFPSRHATCAFVIAMSFFNFFPVIGGVMLILASALAYIRFALGLHYPSDLTAGALLGILAGILGFFF